MGLRKSPPKHAELRLLICEVKKIGIGRRTWRSRKSKAPRTRLGSTVKQPEKLPAHVLADEKHTWALGQEVSVPTTIGGGCILGATVTEAASADALEAAYGEFAQEACEL